MTIHRAVVARVRPLTTTMARITFHGEGLAAFTSTGVGDEYVRLFLPHGPDRTDVSLPDPTDNGGWQTPRGGPRPPYAPTPSGPSARRPARSTSTSCCTATGRPPAGPPPPAPAM